MRDVLTTALEVTGMISLGIAAALLTGVVWVAFAVAGVVLFTVGVLEGRVK